MTKPYNLEGYPERVAKHRPNFTYTVHSMASIPKALQEATKCHIDINITPLVHVTSHASTALQVLGSLCLNEIGEAQSYVVAHVEYSRNRYAEHAVPANISQRFSLAEFTAHHAQWKQDVTNYCNASKTENIP